MGQIRIKFPIFGIHRGLATEDQPQSTAVDLLNVRPFDPLEGRARGGQRPGIVAWGTGTQIGGAAQPVVAMCVVSSVLGGDGGDPPPQ